ncbi:MAG: Alanine-tRNA ligase [Microgenomates group bacterium GW2011_GWC1_39_12]|nr:MAG: Alanine-tRNA ligase [Microgenomates group bacterium GW2011_GWC1_39_12]
MRNVLGDHIGQKGSNITVERLRFDFSHPAKISIEELKKIEDMVNGAIARNYPVSYMEIDKQEALSSGALGFFTEKYGDKVKVYTIGPSREICGGPHVSFTGQLGRFTIDKEESASAGIRRIYAHLTHESNDIVSTPISSE